MKVNKSIQTAALMLGSMLGQFGNDVRPKEFVGKYLEGSYNPKKARKKKQAKLGPTHRRSYLCGRPEFRYI